MFSDKKEGDIYEAGNMVCKYSMLIEGRTEFTCIKMFLGECN